MHFRTVVVIGVLLLFSALLAGAGDAPGPWEISAVRGICSPDMKVREKTQRDILEARARMITELVNIAKDEKNRTEIVRRDYALRACYLLGELHAVEGSQVLSQYIEYSERVGRSGQYVMISEGLPRYKDYYSRPLGEWATVGALVKIGEPCIPAVMKRLSEANVGPSVYEACGRVLLELRGRDGAAAIIKVALTKETDLQKRESLKAAYDWVKKAPECFKHDSALTGSDK